MIRKISNNKNIIMKRQELQSIKRPKIDFKQFYLIGDTYDTYVIRNLNQKSHIT